MTDVRLVQKGGRTLKIEIRGHAAFAGKGEDIVCAGLSTVIQSLAIGLKEILGRTDVEVKKDHEGGFMSITLGKPEEKCATVLMETAAESLRAMAESYPSHVRITEVEQDETF
ncbi:MAG: ribosomal-processing cysteine protease Prp [Thermovirgaceae bacterium]